MTIVFDTVLDPASDVSKYKITDMYLPLYISQKYADTKIFSHCICSCKTTNAHYKHCVMHQFFCFYNFHSFLSCNLTFTLTSSQYITKAYINF